MVDVFSPQWFYGKDLIFDAISVIVLFLISYFSFQCYNLNKQNKRHVYLSISFLLIAIGFLAKIIVNYVMYFTDFVGYSSNIITLTQLRIWSTQAPLTVGVLLFRFLTLYGLYLLFRLSEKKKLRWTDYTLMGFILAVTIFFTQQLYYIFYAISFALLLLIAYNYWNIYNQNKNKNTQLVGISFGLLALSQAIFFFIRFDFRLYVIAEAIQLFAFIILLITFIQVLNNGKKKKQT